MSTHLRPVSARIAAFAAAATLLVGYQLLAHRITISSNAAFWSSLWAVTPMAALLLWLAWRTPRPGAMLALWLALMAALGHYWPQIQSHQDWVYFSQHLAANLLLMLSMGLTLGPGRQPLCSRLAARARGRLTAEVAAYTRGVTAAWTLFFGLMAVTSAALFWLAPIEAWSIFANLLTAPLVLLMFIGEYGVRLWVLPPEQQSGPLEAIRAYWRFAREPMGAGDLGDPRRDGSPAMRSGGESPDREPRSLDPT